MGKIFFKDGTGKMNTLQKYVAFWAVALMIYSMPSLAKASSEYSYDISAYFDATTMANLIRQNAYTQLKAVRGLFDGGIASPNGSTIFVNDIHFPPDGAYFAFKGENGVNKLQRLNNLP